MPVLLTYFGKKSGVKGGRSLTYVLGNMLSAGGTSPPSASPSFLLSDTEIVDCSSGLDHSLRSSLQSP